MAERRFAPLSFPGEGRGPGHRGSAAQAAPWAPACAGEQLSRAIDVVFGECDR